MEELKDMLIEQALEKGICSEGYRELLRGSLADMINYYIKNPDWCLERNFPDLETLSTRFDNLESLGIFVNKEFNGEVLDKVQTYIFHNCTGHITVNFNVERQLIPMYYFANKCNMRLVPDKDNEVVKRRKPIYPLYIFGKNNIGAKNCQHAEFRIFKHPLL